MKTICLTGLFMLMVGTVWGLPEARLIKLSTSRQTALFNLGNLAGIKEGDYGIILKRIRDVNTKDLRVIPVAKAKNVRMTDDSSVWVMFNIMDDGYLKENDLYLLFAESEVMKGKRDAEVSQATVVAKPETELDDVENFLNDDKDRLAKKEKEYVATTPIHSQKADIKGDIQTVNVDRWSKNKDVRYRTAIFKSPNDEFKQHLRLSTFEKMVTAYLKKVNDPTFDYETFYEDQMRTDFSNEFRVKPTYVTEYAAYLENKNVKGDEDARLHQALLEKGEAWSENFSDEEVRSKLEGISVLQEKARRKKIAAKPTRYTAIFNYGYGIADSQNESDSHRRDSLFSLEGMLEVTPFLKHESLERFTLATSLRRNHSAFGTGAVNADLDETSVSIGANWYPWYAPYAVESPVVFLGTFLRTGWATVTAPTISQKANYTVLTVPGFQLGMKYNLQNQMSLRIAASMETLTLDQYESNRLASDLPDQTNVVESKLGVGFGYSF